MAYSECNWQAIEVTLADTGIATVTLAKPAISNAFGEQMITELTAAFTSLNQDDAVRLVVLNAQGRNFCAGADLNWMRTASNFSFEENLADASQLSAMLESWYSLTKPTMAIVQGACYGGGVGLVAASDMVVATQDAKFCLSEVKLGLIPAVISPYVLQAIGQRQALKIMQTAEVISSLEAKRLGLVHEVTDEAILTPSLFPSIVKTWQQQVLVNSPAALVLVKKLIHDVSGTPINKALHDDLAKRIATIRASADAQQRMRSFLEQR